MNLETGWRQSIGGALAVIAASFALCWPAFWIGYPMLFPDSVSYLRDGHRIGQLLLGTPSITNENIRSALYCLVLYAVDRNATPWPGIALNALLTAWVIWLVVRSLCLRRQILLYLCLIATLSVLTSVSWFVPVVMADILGPVLYLSLYLLVFAREILRSWEKVTVAAVAAWCVTVHPTHVMVAVAVCALLTALWLLHWQPMQGRGRFLFQAIGLVLFAIAAMAAVNARLFGRPSLTGPQPPYLMARILADGTSHDYLQQNCPQLHWTICASVNRLPWSADDFLWPDDGIYQTASPRQQAALKDEELPLILATLRTHPRRQLLRSWHNFTMQLTDFGLDDFIPYNPWLVAQLDTVIPGSRAHYLAARPRWTAMPLTFLKRLQEGMVTLSAVFVLLLLPGIWCRRCNPPEVRLLGLAAIVIAILIANAAATGVLSGVYARYQGRVVWLLPMLAMLLFYLWRNPSQLQTPQSPFADAA